MDSKCGKRNQFSFLPQFQARPAGWKAFKMHLLRLSTWLTQSGLPHVGDLGGHIARSLETLFEGILTFKIAHKFNYLI